MDEDCGMVEKQPMWKRFLKVFIAFLLGFFFAWLLAANDVLAVPLVESGGTITASVGSGSSGSLGATGGGGGGRSAMVNTSSATISSSCGGLVYGYRQGSHQCQVFNNCSVPVGFQRVSKCPFDSALDYGAVCTDNTCAPAPEPQVVEKIVEVPVNNTVVVEKEVVKTRVPWWLIFGMSIAFIAVILAFVFYKRGEKKDLKEQKTAEEYKKELDEKIERVKKEAHEEAQRRIALW
jgi:hypothetical protein